MTTAFATIATAGEFTIPASCPQQPPVAARDAVPADLGAFLATRPDWQSAMYTPEVVAGFAVLDAATRQVAYRHADTVACACGDPELMLVVLEVLAAQ